MSLLRLLVLAGAVLAASPAAAQTTYRWIDANGRTVFSDQAPSTGARQVVKMSGEARSDDAPMPFATRQAAEKFPVTLYTAASCADVCQSARELLVGRGIPFAEKPLASEDASKELERKLGSEAAVPTLIVGQQHIKGYESGAWNDLLSLAGYPKTAPYGAKPPAKAAK